MNANNSQWVIETKIRKILSLGGDIPVNLIRQRIEGAGYSWVTARRVSQRIGVKKFHFGSDNKWYWRM